MEDTRKDKEKKKNTKLRKVHDLSFDVCNFLRDIYILQAMNFLNIEINFINFPELSFPQYYNSISKFLHFGAYG